MYRLVFDQPTAGREPFTTRAALLLIGRSPECQLRLVDNGVSDRHAAIERAADGYYIRDLRSANGIRINNQTVSVQRLASGDLVEVGAVRLQFEIIHQPPPSRRSFDLFQCLAAAIIVALLAGQGVLFFNIFSVHRSKKMRMATGPEPSSLPARPAADDTTTPVAVAVPTNLAGVTAPTPPPVLRRLLRILKVTRTNAGNEVALRIEVRASVSERELDPAATAISVQFYRQDAGKTVALEPLAFRAPAWENFTVKTFAARYSGAPAQLAGYVVRTYYRNQLQDERSEPPGLTAAKETPR